MCCMLLLELPFELRRLYRLDARDESMQSVLHSIPPSMLALLFPEPVMTGSGHSVSCTNNL